ncbi:hypothetical protein [Vibrio paucivorans]
MVKSQRGGIVIVFFVFIFGFLLTFLFASSIFHMTMQQSRQNNGVEAAVLAENERITAPPIGGGYESDEWELFSDGNSQEAKELANHYITFYTPYEEKGALSYVINNKLYHSENNVYAPLTKIEVNNSLYSYFDNDFHDSSNAREAISSQESHLAGTDLVFVMDLTMSMKNNDLPEGEPMSRLEALKRTVSETLIDFFDEDAYDPAQLNRLSFIPFGKSTIDKYPTTSKLGREGEQGTVCSVNVYFNDLETGVDGDDVDFRYYTSQLRKRDEDYYHRKDYPFIYEHLKQNSGSSNFIDYIPAIDVDETLNEWNNLNRVAGKIISSPQLTSTTDFNTLTHGFLEKFYAEVGQSEMMEPEYEPFRPFFGMTCRNRLGGPSLERTKVQYQGYGEYTNIYLSEGDQQEYLKERLDQYSPTNGTYSYNGLIKGAQALYMGQFVDIERYESELVPNFDIFFDENGELNDFDITSQGRTNRFPAMLIISDGDETRGSVLNELISKGFCDKLRENMPNLMIGLVGVGYDPTDPDSSATANWMDCVLDEDLVVAVYSYESLKEFVEKFMRASVDHQFKSSPRLINTE